MAGAYPGVSSYSLDHVVVLLDTPDFETLPSWLTDSFTVIEGGTHAGGTSRNKLVVFPDGTYLEFINWLGKPKEFFDWAPKDPGLIDFALTGPSNAQETFSDVTKRLEGNGGDGDLGIRFYKPLAGGRKRKDGQDVKWHVTKPRVDNEASNVPRPLEQYFPKGRLDTPFFCHDVTDRSLRVPFAEREISETHPSNARGILSVEVLVPEEKVESYTALYASVLGVDAKASGESKSFALSVPNEDEKALQGRVAVEVRVPANEEDETWLKARGVGIRKIKILAQANGKDDAGEAALDGQGIGASFALVKEAIPGARASL